MQLERKICLVTGGSRGIGRAIVGMLAEQGAVVYFSYRNGSKEIDWIKSFDEGSVHPVQCDVRDYEAVHLMVKEIQTSRGAIDCIINNAGITKDKNLFLMSLQDWKDVIQTNLNGTFNVCRCAIAHMMKRKSGKIINIASITGISGNPGQCNYAASKAGIIGFSKSLAKEVAAYRITVNVVAPGLIATDMTATMPEKARQASFEKIPLKRLGSAGEVAAVVSFLLSDASGYMTGEVIKVDGGAAI